MFALPRGKTTSNVAITAHPQIILITLSDHASRHSVSEPLDALNIHLTQQRRSHLFDSPIQVQANRAIPSKQALNPMPPPYTSTNRGGKELTFQPVTAYPMGRYRLSSLRCLLPAGFELKERENRYESGRSRDGVDRGGVGRGGGGRRGKLI